VVNLTGFTVCIYIYIYIYSCDRWRRVSWSSVYPRRVLQPRREIVSVSAIPVTVSGTCYLCPAMPLKQQWLKRPWAADLHFRSSLRPLCLVGWTTGGHQDGDPSNPGPLC